MKTVKNKLHKKFMDRAAEYVNTATSLDQRNLRKMEVYVGLYGVSRPMFEVIKERKK